MGSPVAPFVAAGDAPSPHVALHVLLTYVQSGIPSLVVDAVLLAAAVGYVVATGAVTRRRDLGAGGADRAAQGRPWPATRTASWLAGLLAVFVAVGSGLAAYDGLNASAHVVQHVLLMMVAPPLLLLGRPVTVLLQVLSRPGQVRAVRVLRSRPVQLLTGPVASPLYFASMAAYFLTPVYALSERTAAFHDATHGWFLVAGCLFWAGVVGDDLPGHRRSPTARLATLMAGMPVETAIAVALLFWPWSLCPGQPAAAAHHAGIVLWIGSMLTSGVGIAVVLTRWMGVDARQVRRQEAAARTRGGLFVRGYEVRADGSAVPVVAANAAAARGATNAVAARGATNAASARGAVTGGMVAGVPTPATAPPAIPPPAIPPPAIPPPATAPATSPSSAAARRSPWPRATGRPPRRWRRTGTTTIRR